MGDTTISWTDKTWNPTRGCSRVSQGCVNCYAERQALRFSAEAVVGRSIASAEGPSPEIPAGPFAGFVTKVNGHASWTGKVELVEHMLDLPLRWKKPCRIFVNSMSDLFHEALPDEAIDRVFAVMALCPQHTFQILTKRACRLLKYLSGDRGTWIAEAIEARKWAPGVDWNAKDVQPLENWPLPNVWLGVSCEDQSTAKDRTRYLRQTPAAVRFISQEPQISDIDWAGDILDGISWLIQGGESGPGARPFQIEWARKTKAQCAAAAGVAYFLKQLGAVPITTDTKFGNTIEGRNIVVACQGRKTAEGQLTYTLLLDDKKGGLMTEWPSDLYGAREFPR